MNSVVYAVTMFEGNLIAGGAFSEAGGTPANCIAMWDGISWSPLGSGVGGMDSPRVFALIVYNGELIAGGHFVNAGGGAAYNIARWDGNSWSPLGSGVNGAVYALAIYDGRLIAGGEFINIGGLPASCIAQWDGLSWSGLGAGVDCVSCGNARAVLSLVVHGGDTLIAGGWFDYAGGSPANYIAAWTGSWAPLGQGMDYPVSALIDYNGDLIAGGAFSHAGGQTATGIARWDGASWSPLGEGVIGWYNWVRALAVYNGDLIAGGYFDLAGGEPANHIARWDGGSWSTLDEGTDGSVASLAVADGRLIVGGSFEEAGGIAARRIAHWDDQLLGACCHADGVCTTTVEADCQAPNEWLPGTACNPNPCSPTPVLLESWAASSLVEGLQIHWKVGATGALYRAWRDPAAGPQDSTPTSTAVLVSSAWASASAEGAVETLDREAPRGTVVRYFLEMSPGHEKFLGPIEARWDPPALAWSAGPTPFDGSVCLNPPVGGVALARVFDPAGRLVRVLARADGATPLEWDGRDDAGRDAPAGVYIVRVRSANGDRVMRLVKVR